MSHATLYVHVFSSFCVLFQFPRSAPAAHMRMATAALQPTSLTTPTGSPLPHYAENEVTWPGRAQRSCVNHSNKLISAIWPSRQTAIPRRSRLFCHHRLRRRCRLSLKMEGREVQTWRRSRSTRGWTSGARGASIRGTERREGIVEGESVNARATYTTLHAIISRKLTKMRSNSIAPLLQY